MKKQFLALSVIAGLMVGNVLVAQAASNATVVVNGQIAASTCDVNVDNTAAVSLRDVVADFGASPAQGTVAASRTASRTISVDNCDGTPAGTDTAQVTINGTTQAGSPSYFDDSAAQPIAVVVSKTTNFAVADLLAEGDPIISAATPGASLANGTRQVLNFALVQATGTAPAAGDAVTATLDFQYEEK